MTVPVTYRGITAQMHVTDPNDHIEKCWIAGNFYEAGRNGMLHYVFENYTGLDFLDVGAHRGNHSVFFGKICKARSVISIEPNPESFAALQSNTASMSSVTCINAAVWSKPGKCNSLSGPDGNSGMAGVSVGSGDIPLITIDSLNIESCHVMKIDTEGMGMDVLKGATETLEMCNPAIFIEANTDEEFRKIRFFLDLLGYRYSGKKFNHTPTYLFLQ